MTLYLEAKSTKDPQRQQLLATHQYTSVHSFLAENPYLCDEVQAILVECNQHYVKQYLAKNININVSTQLKLAVDPELYIRESLAQNITIDPLTQNKLAQDIDHRVRNWLAKNINLTIEAFKIIEYSKIVSKPRALKRSLSKLNAKNIRKIDGEKLFALYHKNYQQIKKDSSIWAMASSYTLKTWIKEARDKKNVLQTEITLTDAEIDNSYHKGKKDKYHLTITFNQE